MSLTMFASNHFDSVPEIGTITNIYTMHGVSSTGKNNIMLFQCFYIVHRLCNSASASCKHCPKPRKYLVLWLH